ncbi:hypothetical protein CHS0354_036558 [Potamilus streckersoni]|uniref:Uncharacterized protein n=1 Tax=Potamilus streckersoni TaxID=2493646 RepID=A0AAE0SXN5_9BIVA|nr:hypothetical protein CHS0354_036558 [Potamilus streckersoni]
MNRRPGIYWCNLSCCDFAAHIFLPALGVIGIKVPSRSNSVPKFGKQAEEAVKYLVEAIQSPSLANRPKKPLLGFGGKKQWKR